MSDRHSPEGAHDQSHDQSHDHAHASASWPARLAGQLRHALTPHTHDSADKTDTALESSTRGLRVVAVSFVILLLTALVQAVIVAFSGSVALLGDTLHNLADALTAVPLAIAFSLGRRAATRRFTYGYGRAEDLAGVVIVALIAISAAAAGYEAVRRLLDPQDVQALWWVAAAGLAGFAGNEWVARYRIRVGREIGSAALVADGLHARTDGFTSLAVLLSALGTALGLPIADPLIGLFITAAILFVLRDAARQIYHRLMDAVDPHLVDQAERILRDTAGVRHATSVRLRWCGHALQAEADILLDPDLSLIEAHAVAVQAEHHLMHALPQLRRATIHTDPDTPHATNPHAELTGHR